MLKLAKICQKQGFNDNFLPHYGLLASLNSAKKNVKLEVVSTHSGSWQSRQHMQRLPFFFASQASALVQTDPPLPTWMDPADNVRVPLFLKKRCEHSVCAYVGLNESPREDEY